MCTSMCLVVDSCVRRLLFTSPSRSQHHLTLSRQFTLSVGYTTFPQRAHWGFIFQTLRARSHKYSDWKRYILSNNSVLPEIKGLAHTLSDQAEQSTLGYRQWSPTCLQSALSRVEPASTPRPTQLHSAGASPTNIGGGWWCACTVYVPFQHVMLRRASDLALDINCIVLDDTSIFLIIFYFVLWIVRVYRVYSGHNKQRNTQIN